ncbi:alpha/beta fold hydrolase [Primorskyibacter sp. S187A]|uniref:alpha/beta fold hydrolase n=1 Tax=Primorskyibacter sp. S187A TaxID=3415130 RepID=UPI003C7C1A16
MPDPFEIARAKWVLLPGTLCSEAVFDPVMRALGVGPQNRSFVPMDAPRVSDYDARLRERVTGGEIVCGFSLGAMVAAHNLGALANASALVLLACNPFPDPPGNRANRERVRDRILRGGAREWVAENWSAMSTSTDPAVREAVIAMAEQTRDQIPAQTELASARPGAAEALRRSTLPLVFVTGAQDRLTPGDQIRQITDTACRAHLSILDGLGHFALLEAPARVAQAIRAGLETAPGFNDREESPSDTRRHSNITS